MYLVSQEKEPKWFLRAWCSVFRGIDVSASNLNATFKHWPCFSRSPAASLPPSAWVPQRLRWAVQRPQPGRFTNGITNRQRIEHFASKKKNKNKTVSYSPASKKVPSVVPINAPMAAKNPKRVPARSARLLQLGVVTPSLAELAAPGTPGNGPRKRRWRRREAAPAWKWRETWHEETWCVQTWCGKFPTSLLRQKKMQSILWVSNCKSSNDFKMLHDRLALNPHLVAHLRVIK